MMGTPRVKPKGSATSQPDHESSTPAVSYAREPYIDTTEAADMLRLSPRTLERMRIEGCGPRFLKAGPGIRAKVLYRPEDVRQWLEAITYGSTSEYGKGGKV